MSSQTIMIICLVAGIITLLCIFIGIILGQRSKFSKFDSGEDYARGGKHKSFKEYTEEPHTEYQSYDNDSHEEFKEYTPHTEENGTKTVVYQNKDKKSSGCCLVLFIVIIYFFVMIGSGVFSIFKTTQSILKDFSSFKNTEYTVGDTSLNNEVHPDNTTTLLEEFANNEISLLDYYSIDEIMDITQKLKTRKRIYISDYTPDHPLYLSYFNKTREEIQEDMNFWRISLEELDKKDYFLSHGNFLNDGDSMVKFVAFIPLSIDDIYTSYELSDLILQYFNDSDESIKSLKVKTPKSETVIKKEDLEEDMFWDLNDKLEDLYKEFADDYNYAFKVYDIADDCVSVITVEKPDGVY